MKILSKELALVLAKYEELPSHIQMAVDFKKGNPDDQLINKEVWKKLKIEESYLVVGKDLIQTSFLREVYGNQDEWNDEQSFDTELFHYFNSLNELGQHLSEPYSLGKIEAWVKGLTKEATENGFLTVWHVLMQSQAAAKLRIESSYSQLLIFFIIIELMMIYVGNRKKKDQNLTQECGNKLAYFIDIVLKKSDNMGIIDASSKEIGILLTKVRSKVMHGELRKAQRLLRDLVPFNSSLAERSNRSTFQERLKTLNTLISSVLYQVLIHWMENPELFWEMKVNCLMVEEDIRKRFSCK